MPAITRTFNSQLARLWDNHAQVRMRVRKSMDMEEFLASKGKTIGVSDWIAISQADIDTFGAVTHDLESMHNDPVWCKKHSPYGTTIAYGFQTIALLTALMHSATKDLFVSKEGATNFPLNYGFNYLRLVSPVKVNDRIRASLVLVDSVEKNPGELRSVVNVTVEIEGRERPALVAEWLMYWITGEGRSNVVRSLAHE